MSKSHSHCPKCYAVVLGVHRFCPTCGAELSAALQTPNADVLPPQATQAAAVSPPATAGTAAGGRMHSPVVALLLALLIPGAGQAYNGRPVRGFFVLFLTPLIIPWLLSLWGAWSVADQIRRQGGRFGIGGFVWVILQFWLVCNVTLAVLIGLTIAGVVQ